MRVRRPFYMINSQIMVEDGAGNVVGEVFQRFHLLKRNYDLYLDKNQFATIKVRLLAARASCCALARTTGHGTTRKLSSMVNSVGRERGAHE